MFIRVDMTINNGTYSHATINRISYAVAIFLLVSIAYLAVIVLYFHSYFNVITEALIGPPEDNMLDFWNTWYSQLTLENRPQSFFRTNLVAFPEGTSLYYHPFSYTNLVLIYILRKILALSDNIPVLLALHNGLLLFSFYLSAIGAFYLTKRFTRYNIAAFLGGFVFAFSPFHVAHLLHHMPVTTIQYIPFFIICFLKYNDTGEPIYLLGSILLYFLNALSCWYYLVYIGYFMVFYYVYNAIMEKSYVIKRLLLSIFANVIGVVLLLLPILVPMISMGLKKDMYKTGHEEYVADLAGYIVFHPYHLLAKVSQPIWSNFRGNLWEMTVYLGLVNLGLLIWALVHRNRVQLKEIKWVVWGMIVFMALASGPYLYIFGQKTVVLPTAVTAYIPFFKHVRTPSRAVVFVYLFLGIGVGQAIDTIMDLYSNQKGRLFGWLTLLFILAGADLYPTRLALTPVDCPQAYSVIMQDNDPDYGILDLPAGYYEGNTYMMYQAACHKKPIVNSSGPKDHNSTITPILALNDMEKQKFQLTNKKVKYIVLHKNFSGYDQVKEKYAKVFRTYKQIYRDDRNIVFKVY